MFLFENDVWAALLYEALIPAIRAALVDYSAGRVEQPARGGVYGHERAGAVQVSGYGN